MQISCYSGNIEVLGRFNALRLINGLPVKYKLEPVEIIFQTGSLVYCSFLIVSLFSAKKCKHSSF